MNDLTRLISYNTVSKQDMKVQLLCATLLGLSKLWFKLCNLLCWCVGNLSSSVQTYIRTLQQKYWKFTFDNNGLSGKKYLLFVAYLEISIVFFVVISFECSEAVIYILMFGILMILWLTVIIFCGQPVLGYWCVTLWSQTRLLSANTQNNWIINLKQ